MSVMRHRATAILLLVAFLVASLGRMAPAMCCFVDEGFVEEAAAFCCPSEAPKQRPEDRPCNDSESCPTYCCSDTGSGHALSVLSRISAQQTPAAIPTQVSWVTQNRHGVLTGEYFFGDSPPVLKTALYLQLQVLLC